MSKKQRVYELTNPFLDNYHLLLYESLFHNANGYIGIRYDFEEGCPESFESIRGQYINGFYDLTVVNQPESLYGLIRKKQTMLDIADTQKIKLYIDDEQFSMFEGTLLSSKLTLDMTRGVTLRDVVWRSPKGKEMHIKITRMASFCQLSLFIIEYEIEPLNFSGNIILESDHDVDIVNFFDPTDPRTADECVKQITPISCEIKDGASYITSVTSESGLQVCSCVKNVMSQAGEREFLVNSKDAVCSYKTKAEKGKKTTLLKYSVFTDSIRSDNCRHQAYCEMQKALSTPLGELYNKQEEYLENYWQNCAVEILDDEESNTALQYNLYQLIQSVGKDRYSNIAPKGLSGEGYEGHYFWDSEMYIQPFFTITNPRISKNLISFRYNTLNMAREHARILGHKTGALYPWRTIMGSECSGYYPAGSAQYHINGDIAYSIIAYYLATGDLDFIREKGAEVIFETARLWLDVGNYHNGKFHINGVTGPDEYTCMVNNNYYTNVLAKYHLKWAAEFYHMLKGSKDFARLSEKIGLKEEEIKEFDLASAKMHLPYDEKLGINPQDDSFLQKELLDMESIPRDKFPLLLHFHPMYLYRHQICKQADTVLAYFILEDAQPIEVIRRSYEYYEKITTHDSSLSKCIFCIMAARLGMTEKAFDYFGDSLHMDLQDQCRNTRDGIHTSNMAGMYMSIVYGFGGLRLKEQGLSFAPQLPSKWAGYSFKARYKGSRFRVEVTPEEYVFILEEGNPQRISVYDKEYMLEDKLVLKRISCHP